MENIIIQPVLVGGDINCYSVARAYHEAYGVKSIAFGRYALGATKDSNIIDFRIDPRITEEEEFNPNLNFKGCFITMDTATTVNKVIKKELKNLLGDKMFNTTIKQNVKVIESTFDECPVVFGNKKARASINYKDLCKEVF